MRWYVMRGAKVVGPFETEVVHESAKKGELVPDMFVRDESGGSWMPIGQSPFAGLVSGGQPLQMEQGGEALGYVILVAPFLAGVLVWFWIGNMNLFQDPASNLFMLAVATVGGTAILIAIEASGLGMGKRLDSRGKKGTGPVAWFLAACLMWF